MGSEICGFVQKIAPRGARVAKHQLHAGFARVPLVESHLSWDHENNTLIVQYKKPKEVMAREKEAKVARLQAPEAQPGAMEGAAEEQCKQQ